MVANPKNILLTGLPRAGSCAAGALMDGLPDTVCLNAPRWHAGIASKLRKPLPFGKWLLGDFYWQRRQLLAQIPVSDLRAADGTPLMDGLRDPRRISDAGGIAQTMEFTRPGLSNDFILCMRHHALYTAALPTLVEFEHFRIIAVIRNPVDAILSWQQTPGLMITPSDQHGLSAMWPQAHKVTASDMPTLDKMAQLVELFFQRYHEWQDHIDIVKYEHLVHDPLVVSRLFDIGKPPKGAAAIVPPPQARRAGSGDEARKALRKYAVFAKKFYPDL